MEAKTLVAIEIASSKIKGAVATVGTDGIIKVIAVEQLISNNGVRYGRVQNVKDVSAAVNEIIHKLENNKAVYPRKIQAVTLSLGGRSLAGAPASATLEFLKETEINDRAVNRLKADAAKDFVGNKEITEIIARNYFVNNVQVKEAVGTVGKSLRGEFLLLTCSRENRQNLDRLKFDTICAGNLNYVLRPLAIADAVLNDDDRQLGCVLVDFGAETTTVSIYQNGSLVYLATLPMGSRLITRDLMTGMTLTESAAEDLKIRKGSAGSNPTPQDREASEANNFVRARAGEIAANIVHQIELSGVETSTLGAGIVLVGGGSKLHEFRNLLSAQSHMALKFGKLPSNVVFADPTEESSDNIDVVAILLNKARDFEAEDCLSPNPVAEMPQEYSTGEPTFYTKEDGIYEEPKTAAEEEPVEEYKPYGGRRVISESDDDLLKDDDDEIAEEEPEEYEDDEYDNSYDEEEGYGDDEDYGDDPDDPDDKGGNETQGVQKVLDNIRQSIANFFGKTPDDED